MPITKSASKEAFRENIRKEVRSGKPVKQAVAIAYSAKRAATKDMKKHEAKETKAHEKRETKKQEIAEHRRAVSKPAKKKK